MKKIITLMLCLSVLGVAQMKAQLAQITLMHDGNATTYAADKTADAIGAAMDGDVLYFSDGSYAGDIIIDKKVALVGVGQSTVINGNVTINIQGTFADMPAHMLDGLNINGNILLRSTTDGVNIRKCKCNTFSNFTNSNYATKNLTIDRCFITDELILANKMESMTVVNSKIKNLRGQGATASAVTFVNCNIHKVNNSTQSYKLLATLINCILYTAQSSGVGYYDTDCVFFKCLASANSSSNIGEIIRHGANTDSWPSVIFYMDGETLEVGGFVGSSLESYTGTDGTVVGTTGGAAPFSLAPAAPRITESVIRVDPETKTLNVDLKVTAN